MDMTTVSELPESMGWGVEDKDPNAEHNFPNIVWDFAQVGDRMFIAGSFLHVQDPATGVKYDQPYLAAFDVETGVWDPSFTPDINGPVFALEVTAAGVLIAGGQFTEVNATPFTEGLVGLDPVTGAKASSFQASVERPWSTSPAIVRSLEVVGNDLYVGGNFSHVRGSGGDERHRVYRLTRVNATTGTPDPTWIPEVMGGGVWAFGIDVARNRIHAGGIKITGLGNTFSERLVTIDLTTGLLVPGQDPYEFNYTASQRDIWDVEVANGKVWVSGEQHVMAILDGDTRVRTGYHSSGLKGPAFPYPGWFSGGAFQLVEQVGDWVIAGCHCTYEWRSNNGFTGNTWHDGVADVRRPIKIAGAIDADTGVALDWSPDLADSEEGAWSAHSDTNGCLWLGGDFGLGGLEAGATFYLGNYARFCSPGPVDTDIECTATTMPNGDVLVAWNDVGASGVDVVRDGGAPIWQTDLSWVDTSPGTVYTVTAFNGNPGSDSCIVDAHLGGGGPGGFECTVVDNGNGSVTVSWDDLGANGYDVSHDGEPAVWINGTSYIDFTPGTIYMIVGWGNGVGGTSTSCVNPNPGGGGGFTCSVSTNPNGSVTISWTDIGANGYDLSEDGGAAQWISGTSAVDVTPGTTYVVTAWGNGVGGTSTSCDNPNPGGGPGFDCSVTPNANGSVTISWTDIGANGYDLSKDGGPARWVSGTSIIDIAPGVTYTVTAWGNGVDGTTTMCDNPNPGPGLGFSCSVSPNPDGSVTVSWPDIGANGYDLSEDGGAPVWVSGTEFIDPTPGQTYTVTAWGNGLDGTTTTC